MSDKRFSENATQYGEAYLKYYKDIFKFIQSKVHFTHLAEELTQEVFTKGLEHIYVGKTDLNRLWFFTVAKNLCIDYWRKAEHRFILEPSNEPYFSSQMTNENDPMKILERQEVRVILRECFQELSPPHRHALLLVYINHCSYKEAAEKMGLSQAAFTSLLGRARSSMVFGVLRLKGSMMKGLLNQYEFNMLLEWFDLLDWPEDLSKVISNKSMYYFSGTSQSFDQFRRSHYPKKMDEFLLSHVTVHPHSVGADFGCATGLFTEKMAGLFNEVYAVDISKEMVCLLKKRMAKEKIKNVVSVCENVMSLSFSNEMIDVGFCILLLHHLFDPRKALKEFARVLRPGGQLIIADLIHTTQTWKTKAQHDFWPGFHPKNLERWITEVGLQVEYVKECKDHSFSFISLENKDELVHVPLLLAKCRKGKERELYEQNKQGARTLN